MFENADKEGIMSDLNDPSNTSNNKKRHKDSLHSLGGSLISAGPKGNQASSKAQRK